MKRQKKIFVWYKKANVSLQGNSSRMNKRNQLKTEKGMDCPSMAGVGVWVDQGQLCSVSPSDHSVWITWSR